VLDVGAGGVIVPLVDDETQAAVATYPPAGRRSYGPMRSGLRGSPTPADSDATRLVIIMIGTPLGLANVRKICATPGVNGVYVGPSDLCLAVGGAAVQEPAEDVPADGVGAEEVVRRRECVGGGQVLLERRVGRDHLSQGAGHDTGRSTPADTAAIVRAGVTGSTRSPRDCSG
jgi:4-hydroxy-2-oxoheptanedioate aldolase